MIRTPSVFLLLVLALAHDAAAELDYVVKGVEEPIRSNVLSHVDTVQFGPSARLADRDEARIVADAINDASESLRPYGYYRPQITARLIRQERATPTVEITIVTGRPVRVRELDIRIEGPGADDPRFREWRRNWPLPAGARLDQTVWSQQKQDVLEIARTRGYHSAAITLSELRIDVENDAADVSLVMETGPRFVMGDINFDEHMLKSRVLESIPRFSSGDPYRAGLVRQFRSDLWRTGYFDDVQVIEIKQPDLDPPRVDFNVLLETETRNTYEGAIGYGTDTGVRLQTNWRRRPISSNGDQIDVRVGWQEFDSEFTLLGNYQLPRRSKPRQWWEAEMRLRYENLDLEVKRDDDDENSIRIASGDVDEYHLRAGRLKLKNLKGEGDSQQFERLFAQFLNSERRFSIAGADSPFSALIGDPVFDDRIKGVDNALSVGIELETVDISGRAFYTEGYRDRHWLFTSDESFGSDVDFTQLYLSTRRSYLFGDRFKILLRAEVGYTDAEVDEFTVDIDGTPLDLSITRLPNFYRFKAGGSASVRGYAFEQLSDNDLGSNHIITASAEGEYRFMDDWSAAAFVDIGNAFNEWDEPDLKRGIGVGIRWYSIAGEIRLDVASALDFDDEPLRIHLSIGTPLL